MPCEQTRSQGKVQVNNSTQSYGTIFGNVTCSLARARDDNAAGQN